MSNLGEQAMEILDELHKERLAYESEYIPLAEVANLLTAYEQTGLEPESIERMQDAFGRGLTLRTDARERLEIIKAISTDRLRKIVEADRDGRCVVLPCKVGATVYYTENGAVKKANVDEIYTGDGAIALGVSCGFTLFTLQESEFFLTREAAEEALKGEQNGNMV